MNIMGFLQETFRRFGSGSASWEEQDRPGQPCFSALSQAVEHVVEEINPRLRAISSYSRRLGSPVAASFRYIDELVESFPGAFLCCRSSFTEDPRVNVFFTNPRHLRDVFSRSEEVREIFDADSTAAECWALLCMQKEERRQFGMALIDDKVRKDVMQTAVSFTDHQVVSPGTCEANARHALKCCIFNGLLNHIRNRSSAAKINVAELESQLRTLRGRLQHLDLAKQQDAEQRRNELQSQIEETEEKLGRQELQLKTIDDHLIFAVDVLGNPARYVDASVHRIQLNRMGIKLEADATDAGFEVLLSEIRIASHKPRVGALVRFPREELLPRQDLLHKADLFLAL